MKASFLLASSVTWLVGCGGQAETATLDPQTRAYGLSTDQEKLFCDWLAAQYGGYGKSIACDGGPSSQVSMAGPSSQADCVSQFAQAEGKFKNCPANLGQVQTCLQWQLENSCASQPGAAPDACTVVDGPLCSAG